MSTQFKPASRDTNYLRIAITGPSGAGKTLAALRLGYGLTQSWSKIYVIDTEHGSTSLYAGSEVWEVGEFLHLTLDEPFAP